MESILSSSNTNCWFAFNQSCSEKKMSSSSAGFKYMIIIFLKELKVRKVLFHTRNFFEVLGSLPEQMNRLEKYVPNIIF